MRYSLPVLFGVIVCLLEPSVGTNFPKGIKGSNHAFGVQATGAPSKNVLIDRRYGTLPLAFEANYGQAGTKVRYIVRNAAFEASILATDAVLTFPRASASNRVVGKRLAQQQPEPAYSVRVKLMGANPAAHVTEI